MEGVLARIFGFSAKLQSADFFFFFFPDTHANVAKPDLKLHGLPVRRMFKRKAPANQTDRELLEDTHGGVQVLLQRTGEKLQKTPREAKLEARLKTLQENLDEVRTSSRQQAYEYKTLETKYHASERDLSAARAKLDTLQGGLRKLEAAKEVVDNLVRSLEKSLAEVRAESVSCREIQSRSEAVSKVELELQVKEMRDKLAEARTRSADQEVETKTLATTLHSLERDLVEVRAKSGTLQEHCFQLEAACKENENVRRALESQLVEERTKSVALRSDLRLAFKTNEVLSEQFNVVLESCTVMHTQYSTLYKFASHVFGSEDLAKYLLNDTVQHAGQVGEKATEFILRQLYPDAVIENVGSQQDTCDLLCTFDSELDRKTLLIECKNGTLCGKKSTLPKAALHKFIDNVVNNTTYDGGVLIISPNQEAPACYRGSDDQKEYWFEGSKFKRYNNLFFCKRDSREIKKVIDSALLDIRAAENFKKGAENSLRNLEEHRQFITKFANSLNPKLRRLCEVAKQFHADFNHLTQFAANHNITLDEFPPLKSLLK